MWGQEHTRWLRLITPGVAIALTGLLTRRACGALTTSATSVPLRPPGWVFGVVWPILYLTTGLSWFHSGYKHDKGFVLLVGLLCSWLVVYSCARQKVLGAVILGLATAVACYVAVALYKNSGYKIRRISSSYLLVPLCAWLVFATYLNTGEIVLEKK
jgi:tryptophan-rich sensory protein